MTTPHDTFAGQPDSNASDRIPDRDPLGETSDHGTDTVAPMPAGAGPGSSGAASAWIGRRLGRYEIRELLGSGGMGVVFRAHDTLIERDVAIKILPEEISRDELSLKRFLSEARAAGK
ncbi:MAG TPA: serine/threonine protein kinase, partial [Pirellulales bacterium]|nr:serine/threonine protein kinase [Pirellulales bacterium]